MVMKEREARRYVREQLFSYLQARGIDARKNFRCLNPEHEDTHPSMAYDARRHKVHCFACGADYDTFDLIALEYSLSGRAMFSRAYDHFGLSLLKGEKNIQSVRSAVDTEGGAGFMYTAYDTYKAHYTHNAQCVYITDIAHYFKKARENISETKYLQERGISAEIAERFGLGYDPAFPAYRDGEKHLWRALIIPTGESSFTARNTDPAPKEERIRKFGSSPLFNTSILNDININSIFIVEGELDALSVCEAGGEAIALGSTANVRSLLKLLEENKPMARLLLALDNDAEGKKAAKKLSEQLDRLRIDHESAAIFGEYKDPNEALVADREAFVTAVRSASAVKADQTDMDAESARREEFLQNCAATHLKDLLRSAPSALSTGWAKLDAALGGGLSEGLYVLGAITSLGKTTFALQLCDHLAQSGQDVVFFSLEMSRRSLIAKSVSRHTLLSGGTASSRHALSPNALASAEGESLRALQNAMEAYAKYAPRVYIHEGGAGECSAYLREAVERHVRFTGKRPVVIVDYLQLLAPQSSRLSDKQGVDRAVQELKRLSRDFSVPVFALSSLNRQGYRDAVTMEAFKESGAIEYSSDVLLGMQYKGAGPGLNIEAAKARSPRELELRVLKNRNGASGGVAGFRYYMEFGYFE